MNALEQWRERVLDSRAERKQHRQEIWDRMPEWFDTWVEHNDYVEKVLPCLLPMITQHSNVLEIGPGTGAFTIPLAQHCRQILAFEPSPGMRTALEANLRNHSMANVQVHPDRIENSLQRLDEYGPFDLIFASYALYDVDYILPVLQALINHTSSLMILLGTGEPSEWYRDLRQQLGKEPHTVPPQLDCLHPILAQAGIKYKVHPIECANNYVFRNEEVLLDWWMDNLNLGANQRSRLAAALEPLIEIKDEFTGIYSRKTNALVEIPGRISKQQ